MQMLQKRIGVGVGKQAAIDAASAIEGMTFTFIPEIEHRRRNRVVHHRLNGVERSGPRAATSIM